MMRYSLRDVLAVAFVGKLQEQPRDTARDVEQDQAPNSGVSLAHPRAECAQQPHGDLGYVGQAPAEVVAT